MRIYIQIDDISRFKKNSRDYLCSQLKRDMTEDLARILKSSSKKIDRCQTMKRFECNTDILLKNLDKLLIVNCYRKGIFVTLDKSIKHNSVKLASLIDALQFGVRGVHPPVVNNLSRFTRFWQDNLTGYFRMVLYDRELG